MDSDRNKKIFVKVHFLPSLLVFAFVICSCSLDIGQSQTSSPQQNTDETPSHQGANANVPWANLNLTGKREKLVADAYWPRLSDDGPRLVYVYIDPATGANLLFFANADGTSPQNIPLTGLPVPMIIDAPMFSTDNQTILFSSPIKLQASGPTLFDKIMGVAVAAADGTIPSDWWSVPLSGGEPNQLTHIRSLGLFGSFSPDKNHIASYSTYGIFVMKPDGSEVNMLVQDVGCISGTVNWIP